MFGLYRTSHLLDLFDQGTSVQSAMARRSARTSRAADARRSCSSARSTCEGQVTAVSCSCEIDGTLNDLNARRILADKSTNAKEKNSAQQSRQVRFCGMYSIQVWDIL